MGEREREGESAYALRLQKSLGKAVKLRADKRERGLFGLK